MITFYLFLFVKFILEVVSTCAPERKEFGPPFNDTVLSGPVLHSFSSADEISCQFNCHFHSLCYRYNFHNETNRCELLDGQSTNFKIQKKNGWIFRVQKCDSSVCLNGGTCLNIVTKCVCPCLFSGDICEKKANFEKVNANPVCYEDRGSSYGQFIVPKKGKVFRVKLVHVSGFLSNVDISRSGKWGGKTINTLMTNDANTVLVPPSSIQRDRWNTYNLPGFHYDSPELIFKFDNCGDGFSVESGEALRVWGGEDLANLDENDNSGQSCTDIYFIYE